MANIPQTPVSPDVGLTNETSTQPGMFDQSVSNLDSSINTIDKVFEGVVKAISPKSIVSENEAILDSFVKLLTEESPISVNILDAYSKNRNTPSIIKVQEQFANMYLNNFYSIWRKAKNDYKLKNSLDGILAKYNSLNTENVTEDGLKFFDDEHSMYTAERYILGKSFKEKKGTATAIEYAYKLAWLAGIEGPLRDAYHFDIKHETCLGFSKGFVICGADIGNAPVTGGDWEDTRPGYPSLERPGSNTDEVHYVPSPIPSVSGPTDYDCNGIGVKRIGTFSISSPANLDADACTPFSYEVEGSLLPEFFEAFVMPLAHPVGFNYVYRKILEIAFIDYFNLEFIYLADEVGVKSLCPDGDCSSPLTEVYGKRIEYDENTGDVTLPGGGISGSSLRNFDNGKIYSGDFRDYDYEKYILVNGSYLISYTYAPPSGNTDRVIHYFDVPLNRSNNIVYNSTFNNVSFWKGGEYDDNDIRIEDSIWNIVDNKARVFNSGNNENNRLTQEVVMTNGHNYVIEIEVFDLQDGDSVFIRINNNEQYDPNGNSWSTPIYDPIEFELTENILYTLDYVAQGKEKIEIYTKSVNAAFAISNVRIIPNEPNKIYENHEHSTIYLNNADVPFPLLYTHDIFNAGGENNSGWQGENAEKMTSLYYDHIDKFDLQPIIGPLLGSTEAIGLISSEIGNMIINEWHYGQSEFVTTGFTQVVDINEHQTVDYAFISSETGAGTLRTRYRAYRDLGSVDLNLENFLDTERWSILLVNIDSLQEDTEHITNQGGFIVGSALTDPAGVIIPWGHPDAAYMRDDLSIETDNHIAIIDALNDDDFIDPLKWYSQTDWSVKEFVGQPSSNYAICEPNSDYATTGSTQLVNISVGDLVDYDADVVGPPPGGNYHAPWGQKGLTYISKKSGAINLNTEDYIDDPLWGVYERNFSTSVYRWFDTMPIPGTYTYVRVEFEIQMDPRMEELQNNFLEMRIGAIADHDYSIRINPDVIIPDINAGQTVTYLTSDSDDSITTLVHEALVNLTNVNLKNGSNGQGSVYNDGTSWTIVQDGNAEDYSYIYYESHDKIVNVLDGQTVDYKEILQGNDVITTRYKAIGNRGNINLKTENFNSANWEEVEINKAIKYTSSGFKRWMGEWNDDNIIAFTASPRFKGKVLSTKIEWFDNTAFVANPEDIHYISMEEFTTNTNMTVQ